VTLIRPFARADAPEVAKLYELVMRSGRSDPPPGLARYFERILLDQPWADDEIPSLVYIDDDGSIVSFQGSSVRRARFDGRAIRIGCAGQLVAHPDVRHRAAGAKLLRAYLDGPQELTITDTANERTRQLWMLLGGEMVHLSCMGWVRILRPWVLAEWFLRERRGSWRRPRGSRLLPLLDAATVRSIRAAALPPTPDVTADRLTPPEVTENMNVLGDTLRLHLDYDERFLGWLFDELATVRALGELVGQLVRTRDGRVLGWYIYFLLPRGPARVLQVVGRDRDVGRVLDHLFYHAWSGGAAAVLGRVEPRLLEPLAGRRCLMHYGPTASLAHSRDLEMIGAIASGRSLLTRLDSEWWMQDEMVDLA
jgi:hypothetical protein